MKPAPTYGGLDATPSATTAGYRARSPATDAPAEMIRWNGPKTLARVEPGCEVEHRSGRIIPGVGWTPLFKGAWRFAG